MNDTKSKNINKTPKHIDIDHDKYGATKLPIIITSTKK